MRTLLLAAAALAVAAPPAQAAGEQCRVVDLDFTPTDDLQVVAWLEDAQGTYVDTLYITEMTGKRGLGNRPGRWDMNSAWHWPYGRREGVFPIWAHRHGHTFPKLVFQDNDDSNLSHPYDESSTEQFYCRPLKQSESQWDTQTCASAAAIRTDKGTESPTETSLYPPRADVTMTPRVDDPAVSTYAGLDIFDAVSQATPIGGQHYDLSWSIPDNLATGDYVMWVEVSKEFDDNASYNANIYPGPVYNEFDVYGLPYRGQPSVVYKVPFSIGDALSTGEATSYYGYGALDGADGNVRPPDNTITTDVAGSGGSRLLTTIGDGDRYRVRVRARLEFDSAAPAAIRDPATIDTTSSSATVSFVEPGDDGLTGTVSGYDVHYRADGPLTDANFATSSNTTAHVQPGGAGKVAQVTVTGLLPQTHYWIGIRPYDDCHNLGPITNIELDTQQRQSGEVDACFVATAAYGSLLANDVAMLRDFRDGYLRNNVLGELLVEAYYTFGPAVAGVIGESDELRGVARDALDPLVDAVRGLSYPAPNPITSP